MAIAFRSATTASSSGTTTVTINKPTGTASGDVLIAVVAINTNTATITPPTGWTLIRNDDSANGNIRMSSYYRLADGSEGSSFDFTLSSAVHCDIAMAAYTGSRSNPVDVHGGAVTNSAQTHDAPSVTTTQANDYVIVLHGMRQNGNALGTIDGPSGSTVRGESAGTSGVLRVQLADFLQASAGATAAQTGTSSNLFSCTWAAQQIAIKENQPPSAPVVTSPNGGETIDASHNITWTAATDDVTAQASIQYHLQYSANGGGSWTDIIALTTAGATSYNWNTSALAAGTSYRVRARAWDGSQFGAYDESNANFTIQHNVAPNAPTLTAPVGGATIDRAVTNRFTWTFSDNDAGDTQSKYDLRYRLVGAGTWTDILAQVTTNTFHDFAGGTFAAGDYEWQVRTYDAIGAVGPYSSSALFTAASAPGAPTITSPINNQTISQDNHVVTWSAPTQTSFQVRRVADAAGVPDTATVYSDTGEVVSSTARDRQISFPTNNRFEHVQVRVKASGLWSTWASVRVNVAYTPPATPTVVATASNNAGHITVAVTNPTPSGGQPTIASNRIHRRTVGDTSTGTRIKVDLANNGSYTDWAVASGVAYEYRAEAVGSNGVSTYGAWTP